MNPKLSVEIGADVKGMEAALSKADKLLKQHQRNYKGVQNAISQNTQKAQGLEKSIGRLGREFKRGTISEGQFSKETDRLSRELREVNNETEDYQKELRRLDREMDRVTQSTANYSKSAQRVNTATGRAAGGMGRLGNTTRVNAVPAMTSFSQVVQDAPYGIQGVANNIQQLTMQMGYLSTRAGGTKGAFKALVSSLVGPAGILLAVSLVTTVLVTYGDKLFDTKTKAEKLKEAQEKLTESVDKYKESLKEAAKAQLQGANDATQQLTTLQLLKDQLDDTSLSEEKRLAALGELKKLYPSIFSGIKEEQALNKGLGKGYDELEKKLNDSSKAGASAKRITELKKELNDLNSIITGKFDLEKLADLRQELDAFKAGNMDEVSADFNVFEAKEQLAELDKYFKRRRRIKIDIGHLENQIKEAGGVVPLDFEVEEITNKTGERPTVKGVLELEGLKAEGSTNGLIQWKTDLEAQLAALKEAQAYYPIFSKEYKELADDIASVESRLEGHGDILRDSAMKAVEGLKVRNDESKVLNDEYLAQNLMMAQALSQAFGTMANNVIDSMMAGELSLHSFSKMMFSTISKMLVQMAQAALMEKLISKGQMATDMATAQGNAAVMASSAAAAMGPAGVVAFPGLLASMSGIVSGFFGGLQAFAHGGVVQGGSSIGDKLMIRANAGEVVLNKDQQKAVYSQMQAPKVISTGNNTPIIVGGAIEARGDVLRVILDRSDRRRGRI